MIAQISAALAATVAFSILFHAPSRELLFCGIVGAVGWGINIFIISRGLHPVFACFAASLALTLCARFFSYRRKAPVTVFLTAGIFPLVPGAGIYYTAFYSFSGDFIMAFEKGTETLMLAGAIVVGILFGLAVPKRVFHFFHL